MNKALSFSTYISVKQFDHEFNNQVTRVYRTRMETDSESSIISSKGAVIVKKVQGDPYNNLFIKCISGAFEEANVNLELEINDWDPEGYVFMPGALYNGNRFESRKIPYSPKLVDEKDIGPDKPIIIGDIPRLTNQPGFSRVQLKSGSLALPCIGIYSGKTNSMVWLFTRNISNGFETGISVEENISKSKLKISLSIPGVRENSQYTITSCSAPVQDKGIYIKTGTELQLPYSIVSENASSLDDFFAFYFRQRNLRAEGEIQSLFSLSSCFKAIENKYNQRNWVEQPGYYSVGMRNGKYPFLQDWQLGWTGGMISTLPLLQEGDEISVERTLRHFQWFFDAPLSASGLFWDSGEKGDQWYGGDIRRKHTANWHLTRKSADAVYYLVKQFKLLEGKGYTVENEWKAKTKSVIETIISVWKKNKQLGQFINSESGEIEVGGSTSAALFPAGLLLAADYFKDKTYTSVAEQIAENLYQNYLAKGISCGGPGDALQAADSESAYGLLETMVQVYEHTKSPLWLERAKMAVSYFSSWVMAYNYKFPEETPLGQLKVSTRGSVMANTQNTHAAPGICTYSGSALLKLFRFTKDIRYLNLLQEITQNMPQYLSHPARQIPGMGEGFMSERINTCDWLEGTGELMYGSTWSEVSLMLTYAEIPGVYVVPDIELAISFDHIICKFVKDQKSIEIYNPTNTNAFVYIFVEETAQFGKCFEEKFLVNRHKIKIKAKNQINFTLYR